MHVARRSFGVLLTSLALVSGCATSSTPVGSTDPEIKIEQLPDSGFVVEEKGSVSIAYQMTVRNPSLDPITLKQIEMQAIGRSPYLLRKDPVTVNETIEPGKEAVVPFSMWSYPRAEGSKPHELVSVQGTAQFDTKTGTLRKSFAQQFRAP